MCQKFAFNKLNQQQRKKIMTETQKENGIAIIEYSDIENWLENPDAIEPHRQSIAIPNPNRNLFALRQQGNAMSTDSSESIPDCAIIIIDSQDKNFKSGDRFLVKLSKYDTPICRLAVTNLADQPFFVSTNKAQPESESFNPETDTIYGKVKSILL
jgi:hypothetical protein